MLATIATDNSVTAIKPGYTTTEFWLTLLTTISPFVIPLVQRYFKVDISSHVEQFAALAAALSNAAYIFSRTVIKHKVITATTPTESVA